MTIIPVLIIGAFALVLQTLPIEGYQNFIKGALGGFFLTLFELVYKATFGVLSLYVTYGISRFYMKLKVDADSVRGGAVIAALASFCVLAGFNLENFSIDNMGPKSVFLAIVTGLGASAFYYKLHSKLRQKTKLLTSMGADREFNRMLSTLLPITIVVVSFALFNALVIRIFNVDSFRTLMINFFNWLFSFGEVGFFKGLFFVLVSSVLWFFGIHGSDTLESVMQTYFAPGLAANQAAEAAGKVPETILTKEFFDCFVLMGGCGATICLLIAVLIASRNRARRALGLTAALPMFFNINELMVFGLPIIFNPVMLIPFLLVPLACFTTSYIAIAAGIVPMITHEVAWTTPIILGGLRATGSAAGAFLQLFNVLIGVGIYLPFVRILDRQTAKSMRRSYDSFMEYFRANEQSMNMIKLIDLDDIHGEFAKGLCLDLRHGMAKQFKLAYQPQYHYSGKCVGVEALLRWHHPAYGTLYPPLVIKLAEEGKFLAELEEMVLARAIADRPELLKRFGEDVKISVNVTGTTVVTPRFVQFCAQLNNREHFQGKNICLEVTEQAAIAFDEDTVAKLRALHNLGLLLAIDDFSMGHTSIQYLKNSLFDIIKLDGSLVREMFTHENSREIISTIIQLATSLDMTVLAEFVDSVDKREALHRIGCDYYQGYLYSPAVFL